MPLHLLGKKSWNVYNADNIAKVKRDEAAAAAREADEEQRMQEVDAERRIQVLRGIRPDPLPEAPEPAETSHHKSHGGRPDKKRRRLAGEDDTDRDLRLARENNEAAEKSTKALATTSKRSDAPLTDSKGHINLFPDEGPKRKAPKNAEAEAETAKKKKEYEDQYTMRFSNAAGFKESIGQKPWYSSAGNIQNGEDTEQPISKDVWGNEDPRRKERAQMRLVTDDPMAIIQKGVSDLRQVEKERKRLQAERQSEMKDLIELEKRHEKKKRKRRDDENDLEDFNLDKSAGKFHHKIHRQRHRSQDRSHERCSRDGRHHRHRSRSHERKGRQSSSQYYHEASSDRKKRPAKALDPKISSQIPTPPDEQIGWEKSSHGRYSIQFAHC
ncbi:hypothetical protein G7Y79_00023g053550 [Physcia stellaris]|nr:hypothetical protein G7Y79_00023g053550 [Physcia stellaris]